MSDVGYTDTPYGRCPIKSIRTLATPLITPLVQEFRHLSSSSSAFENSVLLFFLSLSDPWIRGTEFESWGRGNWTVREVGRSAGVERSIVGGFWTGSLPPTWRFDRKMGSGVGGIRGQVIIPGCLSRSLRGQRWITNGKRPCALPGGGCVMREDVDWK